MSEESAVCTHDAAGRCIHESWDDKRAEFHQDGTRYGGRWECVRCHQPIVTPAQAQAELPWKVHTHLDTSGRYVNTEAARKLFEGLPEIKRSRIIEQHQSIKEVQVETLTEVRPKVLYHVSFRIMGISQFHGSCAVTSSQLREADDYRALVSVLADRHKCPIEEVLVDSLTVLYTYPLESPACGPSEG